MSFGSFPNDPGLPSPGGASLTVANTFTRTQTFRDGAATGNQAIFQDSGARNQVVIGGGAPGHKDGSILLYGDNGEGAGGLAWNIAIDQAATTPYRDFVIARESAAGVDSDPDGLYGSYAGSANPSSWAFGLAQPGDVAPSMRLKILSGGTTQGTLQLIASAGQTAPLLRISDLTLDHVVVNPTTANNWVTAIRGDTTGANALFQVQDLVTPATVTFTLSSNGNITITAPGTQTSNFQFGNSSQTTLMQVTATGELTIGNFAAGTVITVGNHNTTWNALGFFGSTAVAKPTVTGSKAANAALGSLLTALANLGLLTDSST